MKARRSLSRFIMRVLPISIALVTVTVTVTVTAADRAKDTLRAGAYAMDITPENFPVSSNGGMRDRQVTGARDPLHARCLVLDLPLFRARLTNVSRK